jgi:hypothetical protein
MSISDDRAQRLIDWLKTEEGKTEFERLRARRFSRLVKPIVPAHLRDEHTFVCHECKKEECECSRSES